MSSMLEPSPRYSPSVGGLVDSHRNLDTAVDLSRKSAPSEIEPDEPEDSEDEAPLDLKVRTVNINRDESPNNTPMQRAEFLRIAEMYTNASSREVPPSSRGTFLHHQQQLSNNSQSRVSRESSQERDHLSRCQYCGDESDSPDYIPSDHGEGICQRGSLACSLCPKTFTQWNHLNEHKKSHHQKLKQRHYPCQSCGKVFTSASNRNMHQRIHKGVRPFQCTPCGVYFRQKAHLQKHQKTQGHLQASELKEKNRLLESSPNNNNNNNNNSQEIPPPTPHDGEESGEDAEFISSSSSSSPSNSMDGDHHPDSSTNRNSTPNSNNASGNSSTSSNHNQLKRSSPKRKQLRPRRTPDDNNATSSGNHSPTSSSSSAEVILENKIRSFVHYNESTHGYECYECPFISHELSTLKTHVRAHHLRWDDEESFKCRDCVISFTREFNLRIHNKKHENESGTLHCDVCDADFKVPHFLLKHMEEKHLACPSCGCIQDDKESLQRHYKDCQRFEDSSYEDEMEEDISMLDEDDSGIAGQNEPLLPPPSLTSTPNISKENRDAKKRKVDSLAESIRLKQELQRSNWSTHLINNNNSKIPCKRPFLSPIPGRKTDMSNVRALLSRPPDPPSGLNALMSHISSKIDPVPNALLGENNNIPLKPVMTPPSSPPPLSNATTISGSMSLKLVKGLPHHEDNNMGLDLTVGRRHRHDSIEEEEDSRPSRQHISTKSSSSSSSFPSHLNTFSFFGLPPPGADPAFAESLLKLAGLPPPPPLHHPSHHHQRSSPAAASSNPLHPGGHNDNLKLPPAPPSSSSSLSNSYIISAALGSSSLPTVFPGLPPTLIPPPPQPHHHPHQHHLVHHPVHRPPSSLSSEKELTGGGSRPGLEGGRSVPSSSSSSTSSSSNKPFRCTFCRKEFGHLSSLDSHMEHMHSGESKHTCETCGKSFSSKSNLTAHKKIHSGERPFECMVCHKRFRQKAHLQKHETTHSSATPYKCSICDKAFGHPSNLNTHMATHSNIRPYSCSECGKSYKDSASFKRHRASHSGGASSSTTSGSNNSPHQVNPCSSCSESFMDLSSLKKHMESVHPGMDSLDSVGEDEDEEEEGSSGNVGSGSGSGGGDSSSGYSSFETSTSGPPGGSGNSSSANSQE